jgi:AcrR family transcriptional regulator
MDDIAVSLGISKRTVYETFRDKGELVEMCINELNIKEEKKVSEVISGPANVIEAIFIFMQEGIEALNSINPVFLKDLKKLYPQLWEKAHTEAKAKRLDLSARLLMQGIDEGLFRKLLNIDIISKLFYEQVNLAVDETIFPGDKYDHSEVFQNMIINFTRGISTTKGIQLIDGILK